MSEARPDWQVGDSGSDDKYLWPITWVTEAVDQMRSRWNTAPDIKRDFVAEYEALQGWFWIPNCYSLMEQAFKLLWAVRNGAPPAGFKDYLQELHRHSSLSHDLGFIYSELSSADRKEIERAFSAYQMLHDYIPVGTAEQLTERIGGCGYTQWRYFLLQGGSGLPTTEIGAMIEIASAAAGILEREQHGGSRFRTVDQRIAEGLRHALFEVVQLQMVALQSEPGFDITRFRALWDQRWSNLSKIVAESPGSIYMALNGSHSTTQDPDEWRLIESICAHLPENDLKNFKTYFFKNAKSGRPRGVDNDAYFLNLHRHGALYELRRFTQFADARDIEAVKRATDYLSSLVSDFDIAGISTEAGSAMEQIAEKGLPGNPPLSGNAKLAVDTLASFQPSGHENLGTGQPSLKHSAQS